MKLGLLVSIIALSASPTFAFDKGSAVNYLLETARQYSPDSGVTREMLERLSPGQLRVFIMGDCEGANKTATFTVKNGRVVGYTATC